MRTKKITQAELDVFLRKHKLWLVGDPEGERANLSGVDLSYVNLSGADLRRANLSSANLSGVDLSGVDLSSANLSGVDLSGVDLYGTNLRRANLSGANLSYANLSYADLSYVNLSGADLSYANLYGAKNINFHIACPEKGSFIGFKKVRGEYIVELEIPEDALRSSATSRKCRCSKAKVIAITNIDGTPTDVDVVYSKHDPGFGYRVGETVQVNNFDTNRWNECAPGIHFFITKQEAVDYRY